jgi:pantothenate kinase-related protein Tda10
MTATLTFVGGRVKAKQLRLKDFTLMDGIGSITDRRLCVMQMAYVLAMSRKGKLIDVEPGDHPPCVADVISDFAINYNDSALQDERDKLRPIIPKMLGTKGDGKAKWRDKYLRRLLTEVEQKNEGSFFDAYSLNPRKAKLTYVAAYLGQWFATEDPERGRKVLRTLCKGEK